MAIIADLFPLEIRGRVMGDVQTSFAASQVMGLPLGVFLSNRWGWHAPFLMILVGGRRRSGVVIVARLQPIDAHLKVPSTRNPVAAPRRDGQRRALPADVPGHDDCWRRAASC